MNGLFLKRGPQTARAANGEKQRIANMTRAPDADDDLNFFAAATRTTEEQRQDRQLRFTKRHGQAAPPPSPTSTSDDEDETTSETDISDTSGTSLTDHGTDSDDDDKYHFEKIISHQWCGKYKQLKFNILWSDGSTATSWECDLVEDCPTAYNTYRRGRNN